MQIVIVKVCLNWITRKKIQFTYFKMEGYNYELLYRIILILYRILVTITSENDFSFLFLTTTFTICMVGDLEGR